MTDTHPIIEDRFKKLIMAKTCQERLLMGCSMFDAAKRIVKSSIIQKEPEISTQEMKTALFLRFYGGEFDEIQKSKIVGAFARGS